MYSMSHHQAAFATLAIPRTCSVDYVRPLNFVEGVDASGESRPQSIFLSRVLPRPWTLTCSVRANTHRPPIVVPLYRLCVERPSVLNVSSRAANKDVVDICAPTVMLYKGGCCNFGYVVQVYTVFVAAFLWLNSKAVPSWVWSRVKCCSCKPSRRVEARSRGLQASCPNRGLTQYTWGFRSIF